VPPSRRRALQFGASALVGSVAGCTSGLLTDESDSDERGTATSTTPDSTASDSTTTGPTTHALGVETSLPEGSVEFPDGPKSRPERPDDLTAETVRQYVKTFEYRWVYNKLYHDETTEVHEECGVDSVTEYGVGFRVVVWCSAWATYESGGETVHADYFTQYATYFVGSNSTVRQDGKAGTR
jgi:hypothetical protein